MKKLFTLLAIVTVFTSLMLSHSSAAVGGGGTKAVIPAPIDETISTPKIYKKSGGYESRLDEQFLEYMGKTYKMTKRGGEKSLTAVRFIAPDGTYIDVVYYRGKPFAYVVTNDPNLLKINKCDIANYSLTDTDCDGIVDDKSSAGCDDLRIFPCFNNWGFSIPDKGF